MKNKDKIILIGSDHHFPFQSDEAILQLEQYAEKVKPDYYIINGDLFDLMCFSGHRKGIIKPESEINLARKLIDIHLKIMKKHCKKIIYIINNHEQRFYKRILEKAPEYASFINDDIFSFKGVTTIKGNHPEYIIDDFLFMHGVSGKVGFARDKSQMSTIIGHTHRSYIDYKAYRKGVIFEMNTGTLCDMNSEAFSYTLSKDRGWTNSFGVIINGVPHIQIIK